MTSARAVGGDLRAILYTAGLARWVEQFRQLSCHLGGNPPLLGAAFATAAGRLEGHRARMLDEVSALSAAHLRRALSVRLHTLAGGVQHSRVLLSVPGDVPTTVGYLQGGAHVRFPAADGVPRAAAD